MTSLLLLTASLVVWFPYALASVPNDELRANAPNGELRMNIVRWVEDKGKDVNRVVQMLDSSQIDIEPNEPYVVHRHRRPFRRPDRAEVIWRGKISEPGIWSLDRLRSQEQEEESTPRSRSSSSWNAFAGTKKAPQKKKGTPPPYIAKKLRTTWSWGRHHDMNYVLNVSQPAYKKVPAGSSFDVGTKNYWEFETPMSWHEADQECRAAGLKLAQPKTHNEVIKLQKVLHSRRHGRDIDQGCKDETWTKENGYCFKVYDGFKSRAQAQEVCQAEKATLLSPTLGNHTAWKEGIAAWSKVLREKTRKGVGTVYAGATQALDGQWYWEDETVVSADSWTPGKPSGDGSFSTINSDTGLLMDKASTTTWKIACQGVTYSYWLGGLGSSEAKCVEWVGVNASCIKDEDHEHDKHIMDLWQTEPDDILTEEEQYALQLQIEHDHPFTLRKTMDKRPFICESACPLGFVNYETQCLLVKKVWLPWRDASATCVEMGLRLYEPDDKDAFKLWLTDSNQYRDTYWIGGSENRFIGKTVDMTDIKGLQFICELIQGTRKMNVTNHLSYEDEQKDFKLPKFEAKCSNRTVTVYQTEKEETYPFSVQMDVTGWMWVEYNKETDEHGSNQCDNNNDWVGGEDCWAHSKWGYSTSYLENGDEICSHGDNARLTLNGTVTYRYNQHEVYVNNDECEPDRSKRSVSERIPRRRSRRSTGSEKSFKDIKTKANSQELDDNNKPLMSYIGKRAAEWVRAQANERDAHLVEYHLDKIAQTVTDLRMEEEEVPDLMEPGSIFEEEFENTGTTNVITTFKKTKTIANTYRWSVKKGLNIEDSHISSYSMKDNEAASNSFSVANNIEQREGTSTSMNQGTSQSEGTSSGTSSTQGKDSTSRKSVTDEQINSQDQTNLVGTSQSQVSQQEVSQGKTIGTEQKTGGSSTATKVASDSRSSSETNEITTGTSETASATNTKTNSATSSSSNTQASYQSSSTSNTKHNEKSSSVTTGGETKTRSSGINLFGLVSFGGSSTYKTPERTESTRSSETSTSTSSSASMNSRTSSNSQTTGSENSQTSSKTDTNENKKGKSTTATAGSTESQSETVNQQLSSRDETETRNSNSNTNTVDQRIENSNTASTSTGQSRENSEETSLKVENQETLLKTLDRVKSIEERISKNQESIRGMESSYGKNIAKSSEETQGTQKSHTQQVTLDKNEEVESSAEEVLDTQNEVVIPPKTIVKIEWKVDQRKVRLPWKASIVMTGWINVRFNKSEDEVCDIFNDDETITNDYTKTRWTYDYTNPCVKDNRLYGYPLSYLADKNYIKEGNGLRFTTSGVFEAIVATSHSLKVTEIPVDDYEDDKDYSDYSYDEPNASRRRRSPRLLPSNYGLDYDDYAEEPQITQRRKRSAPRRLPSKVTEYRMNFDENGNGKADMGHNNRHFRKFHAKKTFNGMY